MIDINVLFCGIIKNVDKNLSHNIKCAINTGSFFKNHKIVLYENNSTDNTKNILNEYKQQDNFTIISEDIPNCYDKENNVVWSYTEVIGYEKHCHIEHICNARNKIVDEINKPEYSDFSHVVMIDFDSYAWDINGIIDSFLRKEEWDAIFANSFDYYDFYALRTDNNPFGPEILGELFWNKEKYYSAKGNDLIPVYSAFNGIGIFKKEIFKKYKYDFIVNDEVRKFYNKYLQTNTLSEELKECIKSPCPKYPIGYLDEDENIFWKSNTGFKAPIICEHVSLNLSLYNAGYKLFINPKMMYIWSG